MNRRRFLHRVTFAASASLLPWKGYAAGPYEPLLKTITDPLSARQIGMTYLAEATLGQETAKIHAALSEKFGPISSLPKLRPEEIKALIATRIQQDFDCNDCVWVDGWLLSRSEAMLFALAALHA